MIWLLRKKVHLVFNTLTLFGKSTIFLTEKAISFDIRALFGNFILVGQWEGCTNRHIRRLWSPGYTSVHGLPANTAFSLCLKSGNLWPPLGFIFILLVLCHSGLLLNGISQIATLWGRDVERVLFFSCLFLQPWCWFITLIDVKHMGFNLVYSRAQGCGYNQCSSYSKKAIIENNKSWDMCHAGRE
jgi:hypothetical protein